MHGQKHYAKQETGEVCMYAISILNKIMTHAYVY